MVGSGIGLDWDSAETLTGLGLIFDCDWDQDWAKYGLGKD